MVTSQTVAKELSEWYLSPEFESVDYTDEDREEDREYYSPDQTEIIRNAWLSFIYDYEGQDLELPSGTYHVVEDRGGMGEGDERWIVFSVNDQFFQVTGWYSSWEGDGWDDTTPVEVEPYEVMVTKYRPKN